MVNSRTDAIHFADRFFGGKVCVVTGTALHCHYHHLDEDSKHWSGDNLLPLSAELNDAIEATRRDAYAECAALLRPDSLASAARTHFNYGSFERSYGCSRLLGFLSGPRPRSCFPRRWDPDGAATALIWALAALRQVSGRRSSLLLASSSIDHLTWLLRQCQGPTQVPFGTTAFAAVQVAALHRDFGDAVCTSHWARLARRLLSMARLPEDDPLRLRVLQQIGMCHIRLEPRLAVYTLEHVSEVSADPYVHTPNKLWGARAHVLLGHKRPLQDAIDSLDAESNHAVEWDAIVPGRPLGRLTFGTFGELVLSRVQLRGGSTASLNSLVATGRFTPSSSWFTASTIGSILPGATLRRPSGLTPIRGSAAHLRAELTSILREAL